MSAVLPGFNEVMGKLNQLTSFVARERIVRRGLKAAGEYWKQRMRDRAPEYTGNLRKEIVSSIVGVTASGGAVRVGPSKKAWYGRFVETGTAGHAISAKYKKALVDVYGTFYGTSVEHPGTAAHPFIRPTLDEDKEEAQRIYGKEVWEAIQEEVGGVV